MNLLTVETEIVELHNKLEVHLLFHPKREHLCVATVWDEEKNITKRFSKNEESIPLSDIGQIATFLYQIENCEDYNVSMASNFRSVKKRYDTAALIIRDFIEDVLNRRGLKWGMENLSSAEKYSAILKAFPTVIDALTDFSQNKTELKEASQVIHYTLHGKFVELPDYKKQWEQVESPFQRDYHDFSTEMVVKHLATMSVR